MKARATGLGSGHLGAERNNTCEGLNSTELGRNYKEFIVFRQD